MAEEPTPKKAAPKRGREDASSIAELLWQLPPAQQLDVVRGVLLMALAKLDAEIVADVATRKRWRQSSAAVDIEVAHAIGLGATASAPPDRKAAGQVVLMCIHAIERGSVIDHERRHLPTLVALMTDSVSDQARAAAKKKRFRPESELWEPIWHAVKLDPEATWKELAESMAKSDSPVVDWNDQAVKFIDGNGSEQLMKSSYFRNLATQARNKLKQA